MSTLLKILSVLASLQNNKLVQEIEACIIDPSNDTKSKVWSCIVGKIASSSVVPGTADHATCEAARALAAGGGL